jgi:hypothetical protein
VLGSPRLPPPHGIARLPRCVIPSRVGARENDRFDERTLDQPGATTAKDQQTLGWPPVAPFLGSV